MPAWQVEFYVIPRRALTSHGSLNAAGLENTPWWATHALPHDYQRRLAGVASAGESSEATAQTWGTPDGNRVDVWSEGGRVTAVTARVDVRKLDSKFGAALIQFVRTANAVLVRSDGLVVEPQIAAYAAALRNSDAWRFSNEPSEYLRNYSAADDDDG